RKTILRLVQYGTDSDVIVRFVDHNGDRILQGDIITFSIDKTSGKLVYQCIDQVDPDLAETDANSKIREV
ncbi:hypothetical protein LCGC14_2739160, partial [marine sediment metagenome]